MKGIDARLLVWLKGSDLFASTAFLTLVGKMGFTDRLAGVKRFDYYRFRIAGRAADADAGGAVTALKAVLDRQSTFYNRNKHGYMLDCEWSEGHTVEGPSREDIRSRWLDELSKSLEFKGVTNFDGNNSSKRVIFNKFEGFIAEVMVEDEDPSAKESVAVKLQSGLGGTTVTCVNRATLWWLALYAETEVEARGLAKEIAVTTRRDSGLLMNPNYESAEFAFRQVSND